MSTSATAKKKDDDIKIWNKNEIPFHCIRIKRINHMYMEYGHGISIIIITVWCGSVKRHRNTSSFVVWRPWKAATIIIMNEALVAAGRMHSLNINLCTLLKSNNNSSTLMLVHSLSLPLCFVKNIVQNPSTNRRVSSPSHSTCSQALSLSYRRTVIF